MYICITLGDVDAAIEWSKRHASRLRRIGGVLEFYAVLEAVSASTIHICTLMI